MYDFTTGACREVCVSLFCLLWQIWANGWLLNSESVNSNVVFAVRVMWFYALLRLYSHCSRFSLASYKMV